MVVGGGDHSHLLNLPRQWSRLNKFKSDTADIVIRVYRGLTLFIIYANT